MLFSRGCQAVLGGFCDFFPFASGDFSGERSFGTEFSYDVFVYGLCGDHVNYGYGVVLSDTVGSVFGLESEFQRPGVGEIDDGVSGGE
jgi:hypothetical protein